MSDYGDSIDAMNAYLRLTKYLTIISVAGNLKTSDDFIVTVKRGNNLESPDSYSCSVNGVAEIFDKNVKIYEYADLSDCPSIFLSDDTFRFEGELSREMVAELGLPQSLSWSLLGVTIFQVPMLKRVENTNNLIMDVIGTTITPYTLDQIRRMLFSNHFTIYQFS